MMVEFYNVTENTNVFGPKNSGTKNMCCPKCTKLILRTDMQYSNFKHQLSLEKDFYENSTMKNGMN